MILKKILTKKPLNLASKALFSQSLKIPKERFQIIKSHTMHTEYQLNPPTCIHSPNRWRVIEDESKIKFLVEEGGFAGCSDIGILLKVGTQFESRQDSGSLFNLKNLVHIKPEFSDSIKNYQFLNQTGSTVDFNYDVESTYLKCSFFEEDIDIMVNLLLDLALREKNLFEESLPTEVDVSDINELVRITAFEGNGIGMPSNGLGQILTNKAFLDFQRKHITPHNTVISMSNVKEPEKVIRTIKQKIKQQYSQFLGREEPALPISKYVGGIARTINTTTPFFEFAAVFPGCHFKSQQMELYNILRTIVGNASSFSSGGPGKGMHSRATKNMLNKQACIESASYVLSHYEHYGLFGLTASGTDQNAGEVIDIVLRELALLKTISQVELDRAKNILVASIYSNVERQSDRLQQLTKHLNSYGRIKINDFEGKIRAVTTQDIRQELEKVFQRPPTFVLRGSEQTQKIGSKEQWMKKLKKSY